MQEHDRHHDVAPAVRCASFPTATAEVPLAHATEVVELAHGAQFDLHIAPVAKRLGKHTVRMLAFNGSVPGPTLKVRQGSELVVDVRNDGDLEATVHWHGLRLANRYDGTHETQAPIPVGESFTYRLSFPDPGVYWYHPHIREDYGQEMGLYGNILVVPAEADYWPPVHRELLLTLDDVLLEDGTIASFGRDEANYAAMGRFGNVMLVNGETDLVLAARAGEVVRLYLTNTANTRVFNVALPGARMKLVGGDGGRCEREEFVDAVLVAPSERAAVDVLFADAGQLSLEHETPRRTYRLATIDVDATEPATTVVAEQFARLRRNPEWAVERARLAPSFDAAPDKTVALVAEMEMETPEGPVVYVCPMHPDVTSETPDRCPKCGMKLVASAVAQPGAAEHEGHGDGRAADEGAAPAHGHGHGHRHGLNSHHHEARSDADEAAPEQRHDHRDEHKHHAATDHRAHAPHAHGGQEHEHAAAGGIEWEDDMVDLNRMTTAANMRWNLVDRETGAVNHEIAWRFRVGDKVKLRLVNDMDSDHPMHHPFHIHGAGRFVVLARDGVPEANLVWKDTVLVRTGETVDILLDITNPGRWMAHCHIAEHHESGMMFSFDVAP
jgi:FtsP/CotA-like multicopper oxidase with cupredoxin domain